MLRALMYLQCIKKRGICDQECKFSVSYTYYMMYWHRQPSRRDEIYMINIYSQSKQTREGRYSVEFYKPNQMLKLTISALTLSDSAVYFCGVREFHGEVAQEAPTKPPGLSSRQPPAPGEDNPQNRKREDTGTMWWFLLI